MNGMLNQAIAAEAEKPDTGEETFNYCVGQPCPEDSFSNPHGTALSIYAHLGEVKHGTMENARTFRDYVNAQTGKENFIYKLVPVEQAA